jgi:bifunctional UDP-N-acetylglucosamine pyrophosphorylase/glucosamine-1-phosphate N-acetyltransferase
MSSSESAGTTTTAAVVLAAGKSTRMRSKTPKTLHPVCGRPLLSHILRALGDAGVGRRVVVVGHQAEAVQAALDAEFGAGTVEYAVQAEQKGTGHAAQMAEPLLGAAGGTTLVLPGDAPLLSADILRSLLDAHAAEDADATLLTAELPDAGAYGRVLRAPDTGDVTGVVEARDATPEQKTVREINTSVYAFRTEDLFRALRDLRPDNAQGELYLTDAVSLIRSAGGRVRAVVSPDPDIVLGVNTRVELAEIGEKMRARLLRSLMLSGVTVVDPATTYVEASVTVGQDTTLLPGTHLVGETRIGEDCVVGPNAYVANSTLGDGVHVRASFIDSAVVGDGCKVGPFAHLRPGSRLGKKVKVGNFVETKAATLGDNVSAGHLTYLGDAEVGADTNIGAGTITCNYDGYSKYRTTIGEGAFIGSNSSLVAPVTIGAGGYVGSGSVVTKDVPADALAVARGRQAVKEGWAAAFRAKKAKDKTPG